MKTDQIKNIKSMNIDEAEIMESINKQNIQQPNDDEKIYELMAMGNEKPAAFSIPSDVVKAADN